MTVASQPAVCVLCSDWQPDPVATLRSVPGPEQYLQCGGGLDHPPGGASYRRVGGLGLPQRGPQRDLLLPGHHHRPVSLRKS